jgi:preprotein translocase subunit SecD
MAKPVQAPQKKTSAKAIAAVTLVVILALSIIGTVLGFTGMKLDKDGLYKLLAWLPVPGQTSNWRQALVPGADLGETLELTYTPAALEAGQAISPAQTQETLRVISRRLSFVGLSSAVVKQVDDKIRLTLPKDDTRDRFYEILTQRGDVTFAMPDGTTFLSSQHFKSANFHPNQQDGSYAISFILTPEGKKLFAEKTKELVGQKMSLTIDGAVIAQPGISAPLTEGTASLPGFSGENAMAYSAFMQTGQLPVLLTLDSSLAGEPLLGKNVQSTLIIALAVAALLVMGLFIFKFRLGGAVAAWLLLIQLVAVYFLAALIRGGFTLSTLVAVYFSFGLLAFSLLALYRSMSEDLSHGRSIKQSLKEAYAGSGKPAYDILGSLLLLSLVLIITDSQVIGGFMRVLALGLLLDLILMTLGLRVLLGSVISLFGPKTALYTNVSAKKEAV